MSTQSTPAKKIQQLREEIARQESLMANCRHDFKDPIYDPEEVSVQDDWSGYEVHGVDRWPRMSFHKETKPRWSRECKHCGKVEYSYHSDPVISGYKPKF